MICPWVFNRSNRKVKGKRITTFIKAFSECDLVDAAPKLNVLQAANANAVRLKPDLRTRKIPLPQITT